MSFVYCVDVTIHGFGKYTKRAMNNFLQQTITAMITLGQTKKQQNLENKNRKENNYIDTSSKKL